MDQEWLKTLAEARFTPQGWQHASPGRVQSRAAARLVDMVPNLYHMALDATEIFNLHSPKGRHIKAFPINHVGQDAPYGFLLVMGLAQVRVLQHNYLLRVHLTERREFRTVDRELYTLEPVVDPFGGVSLVLDKRLTLTEELIIKQLLRDLCTAADMGAAGSP